MDLPASFIARTIRCLDIVNFYDLILIWSTKQTNWFHVTVNCVTFPFGYEKLEYFGLDFAQNFNKQNRLTAVSTQRN